MSEMIKGLTVIFDSPIPSERAEQMAQAIRMIAGVESVVVDLSPDTYQDMMNRGIVRDQVRDKILNVLREI